MGFQSTNIIKILIKLTMNPNMTVEKKPPMNPSQVFLGDSYGDRTRGGVSTHANLGTQGPLEFPRPLYLAPSPPPSLVFQAGLLWTGA